MAELQQDPAYHEGFFDAQDGEPLFPDASTPYEAGWRAFHEARAILERSGFKQATSGRFEKTTVLGGNDD